MHSESMEPEWIRIQQLRRWQSTRRKYQLKLTCTAETKVRIREAASKLLMNQSEYIEWLMDKQAKGLLMVAEEGAFLDGLVKSLDNRTDQRATEAAERAVMRVLYDHGLVASPDLA